MDERLEGGVVLVGMRRGGHNGSLSLVSVVQYLLGPTSNMSDGRGVWFGERLRKKESNGQGLFCQVQVSNSEKKVSLYLGLGLKSDYRVVTASFSTTVHACNQTGKETEATR